jgi:hypothetical protein
MAMTPFYTRFRALAVDEMRVAHVQGSVDIPDGEYGFLELYCDEPDCDCRRVLIRVVTRATGPKIWATINYGWEKPEYYAKWTRNKEVGKGMSGAELDPLNPQTPYARTLLRLFEGLIEDQVYVERLQRHYQLFKAALKPERAAQRARKRNSSASRR